MASHLVCEGDNSENDRIQYPIASTSRGNRPPGRCVADHAENWNTLGTGRSKMCRTVKLAPAQKTGWMHEN